MWAGVLYCTWSVGCGLEYCVVHRVWGVGRSTVLQTECGVWAGVLRCTWSGECGQEHCAVHGVLGMGWSTVLYMYPHEGWSIGRSAALYMECWGWAGILYLHGV